MTVHHAKTSAVHAIAERHTLTASEATRRADAGESPARHRAAAAAHAKAATAHRDAGMHGQATHHDALAKHHEHAALHVGKRGGTYKLSEGGHKTYAKK